jgi:hypothetical protein
VFDASVGGRPEGSHGRRGVTSRRLLLLVLVLVAAGSTGCASEDRVPSRLADGSDVAAPPVELEGVSTPVLTSVRLISREVAPGSSIYSCLQARRPARAVSPLVARVGVTTRTVTYRAASGRWLQGCDSSVDHDGQEEDAWCGGAAGRLYDGHLRDPRLNIAACTTPEGDPVGFAWVEPSDDSTYLVLEQPGYAEVFEVAGGLPIRIATTAGVRVEGSSATFELSEHDADGRLVRRYTLEAAVAG